MLLVMIMVMVMLLVMVLVMVMVMVLVSVSVLLFAWVVGAVFSRIHPAVSWCGAGSHMYSEFGQVLRSVAVADYTPEETPHLEAGPLHVHLAGHSLLSGLLFLLPHQRN